MKNARRSFFVCAALMACLVAPVHAQDEKSLSDARSEMERLRIHVARGQEILAQLFFPFPAVEAIAAKYDKRAASFAVVINKRVQPPPELRDLLVTLSKDLNALDTAGFNKAEGFSFTIEPDFVKTEPLKPFGVQVGGSTSNKAGCFEGTIGAAVVDKSDSTLKGYLTCNHVAAAEGPLLCPNAEEAKEVAPGTAKAGCHAGQAVGRLVRRHPISFIPSVLNEADAAFVEAKDVRWDYCSICQNGDFYHPADIPKNLSVRKCGAGSNYTDNGVVVWPDVLVRVPFIPCGPTITFAHQILVSGDRFAQAGDSGAPAYDKDGKAVGMIFAGDESEWTFLNPADEVLELLHVDLVKCVH
jgi:hypothetical protein